MENIQNYHENTKINTKFEDYLEDVERWVLERSYNLMSVSSWQLAKLGFVFFSIFQYFFQYFVDLKRLY